MDIINESQLPPVAILHQGTICTLIDDIDNSLDTTCTIKLVEQDSEYPEIFYYYLIANDEKKNIHNDSRFPWLYYKITTNTDDHLIPIAQATNS